MQRTSVTDEALLQLITGAHLKLTGQIVTRARARLLWAQLGVEHNAGADATCPTDARCGWNVYCWNFGNRRGIEGDAGTYTMEADEIIDSRTVPVTGRWPAYSTPEVGMLTWMELLREHYAHAWDASASGDALAYAHDLKLAGYYTAPLATYLPGLVTWVRMYVRRWPAE